MMPKTGAHWAPSQNGRIWRIEPEMGALSLGYLLKEFNLEIGRMEEHPRMQDGDWREGKTKKNYKSGLAIERGMGKQFLSCALPSL